MTNVHYKNYGLCSNSISLLRNIEMYIPRDQFLPDLLLSKQKKNYYFTKPSRKENNSYQIE